MKSFLPPHHTCACLQEDGGVTKEIIVPGTGWEEPEAGDSVRGAVPFA
jgi:hypothetical protein